MGKTRLAQHFCESVRSSYASAGGVWFVDLASATTPEELSAVVARTLGREGDGDGLAEILDRLGPALLVLDNAEQLAEACAARLDGWLRGAAEIRVLATSRAALGIPAETVVGLEPLDLDDAVAMFVSRARSVDAGAVVDGASEEVRAIVEAIDRMPLAIELAASRTRVLSPKELAERLARPLDMLAGARPESRHGSVRRAVLDSIDLLSASERRFFALASVMQNRFTTADAERVLDGVVAEAKVLSTLETLGRVSLLRTDRTDDVARHGFFETIREVARELAAADPLLPAVELAHLRCFAARAAAGLEGDLDDGDVDNMLAAHAACLRLATDAARGSAADGTAEDGAPEDGVEVTGAAVRLALALEPALTARGRPARKQDLFAATMAVSGTADAETRARLLLGRGRAQREMGDTAAARLDFEDALALVDRRASPELAAEALVALGGIDDVVGATGQARTLHAEALALLERAEATAAPTKVAIEARIALAHAHRREGDLSSGRKMAAAAATGARTLGDDLALATALYELVAMAMFDRRIDEALACCDEGLEVARRGGLRVMEGAMITARGCLWQDQGEPERARECHAEAARIFGDCGSRHREGSALYYLATTYLERGDPGEALPILERARARLERIGAPRYDALVSSGMALALALLARHSEARVEQGRAEEAACRVPDEPALGTSVRLRGWALEALESPSRDGLEASRERARELVDKHGNDDTRFSLRVLEQLDALGPSGAGDDPEALVVWSDGGAFRPPGGGAPVTLRPDSPMRRILARLVVERLAAPGQRVTLEEIIAAGWPGEKIAAEAALNRAYVAIATLRKKGLREVLDKVAGGYALSPGVALRCVDEAL